MTTADTPTEHSGGAPRTAPPSRPARRTGAAALAIAGLLGVFGAAVIHAAGSGTGQPGPGGWGGPPPGVPGPGGPGDTAKVVSAR